MLPVLCPHPLSFLYYVCVCMHTGAQELQVNVCSQQPQLTVFVFVFVSELFLALRTWGPLCLQSKPPLTNDCSVWQGPLPSSISLMPLTLERDSFEVRLLFPALSCEMEPKSLSEILKLLFWMHFFPSLSTFSLDYYLSWEHFLINWFQRNSRESISRYPEQQ